MASESKISQTKTSSGVFSTGIALFSMFFGAGNLIFPLLIGKEAGIQAPVALLGLMISAILFPLLGLIAMMFFEGNLDQFLKRVGKWPAFILLLALQLAQGPLCLSRLFTLMHASVKPYLPISLSLFSLLMAAIVFVIAYRPNRLMTLLGKVLTPFLILSISLVIGAGFFQSSDAIKVPSEPAFYHFIQGLKGGYMTMDLVAALLFATMVLPHLRKGLEGVPENLKISLMRKKMIGASCIAALLLMLAYLGLCLLSANHASTLDVSPQDLLQTIAIRLLGSQGAFIATIAVVLACLTTAVALAAVFAAYLRQDLKIEALSPKNALFLTVAVSCFVTNLGFDRVLKWTGPFLEMLYPALITLCIFNIAHRLYGVKMVKTPVFLALFFGALNFYLGHS